MILQVVSQKGKGERKVLSEGMCQEKVEKEENWAIKGGILVERKMKRRKTQKVVYVRIEGVGRNSKRAIKEEEKKVRGIESERCGKGEKK